MKNSRILIVASTFLLLLSVSSHEQIKETNIEDVQPQDIGEKVKIRGTIVSFNKYGSTTIMTLSDNTGSLKAVSFDSNKRFSTGQRVGAQGKVTMYKGKLEVVIDSVTRV
ncbi:hypothetical protein GLU64_02920 [Nanohaloarchaea archaeon]|nr:hypothetical protein [Candidatus Nanohaloarchaea archaeon]